MTIGQRQSDYKSDTIIMTLKRQEPSKLGGSTLSGGENEGGVTFPSAEVLFGRDGTSSSSIDSQVSYLNILLLEHHFLSNVTLD